jgi:hypothetical protein
MKTLVFLYTYRLGGWGDFLKGLHTCWCWAKATKRVLQIDLRLHILGHLFPQYAIGPPAHVQLTLNAIDKVGAATVATLESFSEQNEIIIACNWFDPGAIGSVDPLPFFKELYTTLFPVPRTELALPYHVLHCRLGDQYLSEATACKGDNRIKSFARLGTILEQYRALNHPRTLVCSDSALVLDKLLKEIPNSFAICSKPYHIAYPSPAIGDRVADIQAMIQEHQAISESAGVYMMSYSGFPITAAMIKGIPLKIWTEDCVLQDYTDSMVKHLRGLRED